MGAVYGFDSARRCCMHAPGLQPLSSLSALRELRVCYCRGLSDGGVRAALAPLTRHSLSHIDVTGCSGLTQARAIPCSSPALWLLHLHAWCGASHMHGCMHALLQGSQLQLVYNIMHASWHCAIRA